MLAAIRVRAALRSSVELGSATRYATAGPSESWNSCSRLFLARDVVREWETAAAAATTAEEEEAAAEEVRERAACLRDRDREVADTDAVVEESGEGDGGVGAEEKGGAKKAGPVGVGGREEDGEIGDEAERWRLERRLDRKAADGMPPSAEIS